MQIRQKNHGCRWEDVQEATASGAAAKQASVLSRLGGNFTLCKQFYLLHCTETHTEIQ